MENNVINIKVNKRIKFNFKNFLHELKQNNLPLQYLNGLNEINFTILKSKNLNVFHGDYLNNRIRISFNSGYNIKPSRIFVHELGHYIDETHEISEVETIIEEWEKYKNKMSYSSKMGVDEYVADGFEIFYCGTRSEKRKLKSTYKKLNKLILMIHEMYKKKGVTHGIKY